MSERLRTLLFALGALILAWVLVVGYTPSVRRESPRSDGEGPAGLAALQRWLAEADIATARTDDRYDALRVGADGALGTPQLPVGAGHVLLVHTPLRWLPERRTETDAVSAWVRSGNTLIIAEASMEDLPPADNRASQHTTYFIEPPPLVDTDAEPGQTFGNESVVDTFLDRGLPPDWVLALGGFEERTLVPHGDHPVLDGVGELRVMGDLHGHVMKQDPAARLPWEPLLVDGLSGGEVAWVRPLGAGRVVVMGHPSVFSNAGIAEADNRHFVAGLLTFWLAPDGLVVFDDAHQGAHRQVDGQRLLGDARVWWTLLVLVLLWLFYLLADDGSWERLARPPQRYLRRQSDLVRALGGFLAREIGRNEAAWLLLEPLLERIAEREGISREAALVRLEEDRRFARDDRAALGAMIERLRRGRTVNLLRLHALTWRLQEQMG